METNKPTIKRRLEGTVVSDKMQKTRVVQVNSMRKHPKYLKYYKTSRRMKAHDETNQYKVGDQVVIEETRPLSREKRWVIISKKALTN
jgi:small subunit ribosomal protein S17